MGIRTGIVEAGRQISFSCHTFTICMHNERWKTTNFKDFVTGYHEGLFHRTLRMLKPKVLLMILVQEACCVCGLRHVSTRDLGVVSFPE